MTSTRPLTLKNKNMAAKEKTGHRQRLRERLLSGEAESFSDAMLLELLLTFAIRRKDVSLIAEELLRVFGSLSQVLSASPSALIEIKGVGQSTIALLKAVHFAQTGVVISETRKSPVTTSAGSQQNLFEEGQHLQAAVPPVEDKTEKPLPPPRKTKKEGLPKKPIKRKLQVSRSHLFEFNHFSRILSFLYENRETKRVSRDLLVENSGLPDGQVASLVSIGAAVDLVKTRSQTLTPIGLMIAEYDIFLEDHGTLEWCHYKGAGSYQNYFWFEVFNHVLVEESAMTQEDWQEYFRDKLKDEYSKKTIKDHVPKEIRFLVDAYTKRNFSKLGILHISENDQLYRRRYTDFNPLVLAAMIYDFCNTKEAQLFQVGEMAETPGSPAVVFGLDVLSLRQQIERLHDRGWLRYETTHNLDQIRLKPGFSAIEFLSAYFENREPGGD